MILMIVTAPSQTTIALATAAGALTQRRDASWRVGSGQSLASHVSALLAATGHSISELSRLALIDRGGSYTSARVAYAFVQALSFARQLPMVLIRTTADEPLTNSAKRAADAVPVTGSIVPSYAERGA